MEIAFFETNKEDIFFAISLFPKHFLKNCFDDIPPYYNEIYDKIIKALSNKKVYSDDIYWNYTKRVLEDELLFHCDKKKLNYFLAFLNILWFLVWTIEGEELRTNLKCEHSLGNDIYEEEIKQSLPSCMNILVNLRGQNEIDRQQILIQTIQNSDINQLIHDSKMS